MLIKARISLTRLKDPGKLRLASKKNKDIIKQEEKATRKRLMNKFLSNCRKGEQYT